MKILYQIYTRLLSPAAKGKFGLLAVLGIFAAVLETVSISLVLPYISVLSDPDAFALSALGQVLYQWLPLDRENGVYVLSGCLLLAFVLKNLYLWAFDVLKRRIFTTEAFLAMKKVYRSYIARPYAFFLNSHSQDVTNMIYVHVGRAFGVMQNMVSLFSEAVITLFLAVLMIWVNPVAAAVVLLVCGGTLLGIKTAIRPLLEASGRTISETHDQLTKSVVQSIAGIREVKLFQQEERILQEFEGYREGKVEAEVTQTSLLSLQNRLTEVSAIALVLVCVLMCVRTVSADALLATLSLMVMVLLRIRPGLTNISHYLSHLSLCRASLVKLNDLLCSMDGFSEAPASEPLAFRHGIDIQSLSFSYDGKQQVLKDVNMTIPKGSVIGLKGISGGGKTTFANILLGLLRPDTGRVLVDGVDIHENCGAWFPLVSYIPQDIFLMDGTIRENVAFYRDEDTQKIWDALEKAQLRDFVETLPAGLDTLVGEKGVRLSGGQRQRLGIARAVYQDAQVFVFDEPTASLDEKLEKDIMDVVFSLTDRTIVLIAHRLNTLGKCDRVYEVGGHGIQEESHALD